MPATRTKESEPLNEQQGANASRMKYCTPEGLPEASDGKHTGKKRGDCAEERKREHDRRGRSAKQDRREHTNRQDLPTEEYHRGRSDQPGRPERLESIPREATPYLRPARKHSADREIWGIKKIGREARGAEDPRQFRAVMQRRSDGAVPATGVVGFAPRNEELAATGAAGRIEAGSLGAPGL